MAAPSPQPKSFGDVQIGGSANVQLGDSFVNNVYRIENLVQTRLPEELNRLLQATAQQQLRLIGLKKSRRRATVRPGRVAGPKGKPNTFKRPQCGVEDTHDIREGHQEDELRPELQLLLRHVQSWLVRTCRAISLTIAPPAAEANGTVITSALDPSSQVDAHHEHQVVSRNRHAAVVRDHSMLAAILLSLIIRKNVSTQDVVNLLTQCGQDELAPVLFFVLCLGIYRFFMTQSIMRLPAQQFWILEDAYGNSSTIPMDLLIDFSVLQKFLHVRYREANKTVCAWLIEVGFFHLTIGSQLMITRDNWAMMEHIKPGTRVVNAVYVSSDGCQCLSCAGPLLVAANRELHW